MVSVVEMCSPSRSRITSTHKFSSDSRPSSSSSGSRLRRVPTSPASLGGRWHMGWNPPLERVNLVFPEQKFSLPTCAVCH